MLGSSLSIVVVIGVGEGFTLNPRELQSSSFASLLYCFVMDSKNKNNNKNKQTKKPKCGLGSDEYIPLAEYHSSVFLLLGSVSYSASPCSLAGRPLSKTSMLLYLVIPKSDLLTNHRRLTRELVRL